MPTDEEILAAMEMLDNAAVPTEGRIFWDIETQRWCPPRGEED